MRVSKKIFLKKFFCRRRRCRRRVRMRVTTSSYKIFDLIFYIFYILILIHKGISIARTREGSGLVMFWFMFGYVLVYVWFYFGSSLVMVWLLFGCRRCCGSKKISDLSSRTCRLQNEFQLSLKMRSKVDWMDGPGACQSSSVSPQSWRRRSSMVRLTLLVTSMSTDFIFGAMYCAYRSMMVALVAGSSASRSAANCPLS